MDHTITTAYQTAQGTFATATTVSGDTELVIDVTLAAAVSPAAKTWTGGITVANLRSLMLKTTGAVTVRATNGSGAILFGGSALAAGTLIYSTQATAAAALGGSNITALHFLSDTSGAVVSIRGTLVNLS